PDLVQEERSPVRHLEEPALPLARVGEGAPLEAEHLRLEQGLGDGRAVDVHERARRPGTDPVERAGDEPLAGAGLALEQDRRKTAHLRGAGEEAPDALPDRDDARALPDQLGDETHPSAIVRWPSGVVKVPPPPPIGRRVVGQKRAISRWFPVAPALPLPPTDGPRTNHQREEPTMTRTGAIRVVMAAVVLGLLGSGEAAPALAG